MCTVKLLFQKCLTELITTLDYFAWRFSDKWRRKKWTGTNGPIYWPARSPALTPLDFYLGEYVKGEKPMTLEDMQIRIRDIFQSTNFNSN